MTAGGLEHAGSIPVGLEPVAVAMERHEAWVVNHVSDSVSIVDIGPSAGPRAVVKTLLVGDEPRDIVFAGPGRKRAFITTAHRGQNIPFEPAADHARRRSRRRLGLQLGHLINTLLGGPLNIITLFTDTPRALAVSPNGQSVRGGSQDRQPDDARGHRVSGFPRGAPEHELRRRAAAARRHIVKFNGTDWVNELGRVPGLRRSYGFFVRSICPTRTCSRSTRWPIRRSRCRERLLLGRRHDPLQHGGQSGEREGLRLEHRCARTSIGFEGPGIFAGHTVRGQHNQNRITVLQPGGASPRAT